MGDDPLPARRWMLVTFEGAVILLQVAVLLNLAPPLPPLAAVPFCATALSAVLLAFPLSAGLLSAWLVINGLAVAGTLVVAAPGPAPTLAALLAMIVGAGLRRSGWALGCSLTIPAVFWILDPAAALPPYCLVCAAGLLSAYATTELVAERARLHRRLEGFQQAVTDQQPLVFLGRFTQGLAHEFGNVLGGARGLLDYAAKSGDPAELREAVEVCSRSLARAVHIVENLKTFTREAPLERRPCDLAQVVADSLALVAPECRGARIEIATEASPVPPVLADPARLQQVFLNLELNALKAMPSGGRLSVRIDASDGHARVSFTDTGVGIPADRLARILEPGFTTRSDTNGLGLGLAVSDRIIRAHGGELTVESPPGAGATFRVRLPVAP